MDVTGPGPVVPSPAAEALRLECATLREEGARLAAELDDLLSVVGPHVEARYQASVGAAELAALRAEVELRALRRRVELLQALANRGERGRRAEVEAQVAAELDRWLAELRDRVEAVVAARRRLAAPVLSDEEARELRRLYLAMARRLHPDLHPGAAAELALWHRVRRAFENGDLEEMRALALLAPETPGSEEAGDGLERLAAERERLRQVVRRLVEEIEETRSRPPFTLAARLADPDFVAAEVARHEQRRAAAEAACAALAPVLSALALATLDDDGGRNGRSARPN